MSDTSPPRDCQIAFLPWLTLDKPYQVAGVEFVPWQDSKGTTTQVLTGVAENLSSILSGYVSPIGEPITNCTVAITPEHGWNLPDDSFEQVRWAASLLFLAAWASNEYYPRFPYSYINSTMFRVVWQQFYGTPTPMWITLTSRRRDGISESRGYKHGQVKFVAPLEWQPGKSVKPDMDFLSGLNKASLADSNALARLENSLPFVELANTDDDLMTEKAEAILMGSAFEQLLNVYNSAFKLGKKLGDLLANCGSVTVGQAKLNRPGIEIKIDLTDPTRAAAQPKWWVHRKWIEELYDLRSKSVHEGTISGRTWGWTPKEHLVMAAWIFPLIVKLLLQREGYYLFSDADRASCLSIDQLLAETGWAEDNGDGPKWSRIVSDIAESHILDSAFASFVEQHPDLSDEDSKVPPDRSSDTENKQSK